MSLQRMEHYCIIDGNYLFVMSALFRHCDCVLKMELPMISRRKEIFFVALCVVFSALFTIGCSDSLLHPAQDGARILVQLENNSLRSGDTPSPTEKWQGSAWIENRDGSKSHHQDISSAADEFSITFENVVIGSEIRIHLDVTSSGETAKWYRGSSSWQKIIDGVNVIVIVLKEVGVDAATPTIAKQPEGETMTFAAGGTKDITKELMVEASVSDGGTLNYQWYSNNTNSTEGGTPIEDAFSASYVASVPAGETKYFYCVITNTNNSVTGAKTAATITSVVAVASVEGELTSITARYNGTNHLLVGESSTNFTVIENYSGGNSVEISSIDGLYTVEVPENSIGNVPVTITSKDGSMQTQVPVQIMYELDVSNLTITGGDTVEQNGNLELTAEYKVNGNDSYNLYTSPDSSSSYKIIENVSISWTGAAQQSDKWKANAETNNTGSKTARVKLSTGDQWCVTTDGIEKPHEYTVIPESGLSYNPASKALAIYNEQGLKNFRDIVNGTLSSDLNVDGQTYTANTENATISATLANDITLTEAWVPIGKSSSNPYTGIFDGNQHTVSGIEIDNSNENPMGLFGAVGSGGTIKNLVVEGTISSNYYAGGIAGYIYGATIEYCVNKIDITNKGNGNKGLTGGIAGYASSIQSTVTGCVNMGTISGVEKVGGILGSSYITEGATVNKCINIGSIITAGGTTGECGGIYGSPETSEDAITNCLNLGSITSEQNKAAGITSNSGLNIRITCCLSAGDMSQAQVQAGNQPLAFYLQPDDTSLNYYDSNKTSSTESSSSIVGTPKTTIELKVATAFDDSWSEWSFAANRYPIPNIQANIPAAIWDAIVAKAGE